MKYIKVVFKHEPCGVYPTARTPTLHPNEVKINQYLLNRFISFHYSYIVIFVVQYMHDKHIKRAEMNMNLKNPFNLRPGDKRWVILDHFYLSRTLSVFCLRL